MDPVAAIDQAGGIASLSALRATGVSERALTRAVRSSRILRLRNGWYSTLDAAAPRAIAIRAGGRLTGMTALDEMGAWVLDRPSVVHVSLPAHASRRRSCAGLVLHWENVAAGPDPAMVPLKSALVRVALDESLECSVPCFDWALRSGRLDRIDVEEILWRLPASSRVIGDWIDERSESVLESIARVRLRARGWTVTPQVPVGWVGRIDMVVEDTVGLELDGREFHQSSFERDRRKDLQITVEGRHALRVSRSMLRDSWPAVERAIEAALRARGVGKGGVSLPIPQGRRRAKRFRA